MRVDVPKTGAGLVQLGSGRVVVALLLVRDVLLALPGSCFL